MSSEIKAKISNLRDIQGKLNELRTPGFTDVPLGAGGIKGFIKRFVRKNVMWLMAPYEQQMNSRISMERYLIDETANILTELERVLSDTQALAEDTALKQTHDRFDEKYYRKSADEALGATERELMKIKWQRLDKKAEDTESPDDMLTCMICGSSHRRGDYETMTSECRFNGGKLVRYVCPDCGVVFGPSKFSALTDEEKGEDYNLHYLGYDEGNGLEKELGAFFMLEPDKEKLYLDYGCGHWSGTIKTLREQGYKVYGYEPYAAEAGNPYILTSREDVSKMRFDGIFSNDLIEHLYDPVADFKFMRTLLRDADSKMSHSTSCYVYKYEITRFHMNFFLGRSIDVLCERSGFKVLEKCDELEEKDFICYTYGIADADGFKKQYGDEGVEILDKLFFKGERLTGKKSCALEYSDVMFGPYMTCMPMKYRFSIRAVTMDGLNIKITSMKGAKTLYEGRLLYGENIIDMECSETEYETEIIIENDSDRPAEITSIMLV